MTILPSLFVSHGSPMTALTPGRSGEVLARLARELPRPRAIVVASAHFLARQPVVGAAASPRTVHDFGGFPQALYEMQYPAPGAPALAERIQSLANDAGIPMLIDPQRGLDHGVWSPLSLLYPAADIPVVPLSIQPMLGPGHQYAIGRALAPLREENVLLIGSGSITHNLHDFHGGFSEINEAPYVRPFLDWIEHKLAARDIDALLDYRKQAPFAERAHPTDEHLLPLFFALGAGGPTQMARRIDAGIDMGFLAMDIYRFDTQLAA